MKKIFLQKLFLSFFFLCLYPFIVFSQTVKVEPLGDDFLEKIGEFTYFPTNLWNGIDVVIFSNLMKKEASKLTLPSLAFMYRDLLISQNQGTEGTWKKGLFLKKRIETLLEMGFFNEIQNLIKKIPIEFQDEEFNKLKTLALFLNGDREEACVNLEQFSNSSFKDKMRISCFLLKNEKEKALLASNLYLDQYPEDENFRKIKAFFLENKQEKENFNLLPEDFSFFLQRQDWLKNLENKPLWLYKAEACSNEITEGRGKSVQKAILSSKERLELYEEMKKNLKEKDFFIEKYYQILAEKEEKRKEMKIVDFLKNSKKEHIFLNLAPLMCPFIQEKEPNLLDREIKLDFLEALLVCPLSEEVLKKWILSLEPESQDYIYIAGLTQQIYQGTFFDSNKWQKACEKRGYSLKNCQEKSNLISGILSLSIIQENFNEAENFTVPSKETYLRWVNSFQKRNIGETVIRGINILNKSSYFLIEIKKGFEKLGAFSKENSLILEMLLRDE